MVKTKLERIVGGSKVAQVLEGTTETLGEEVANAQGFNGTACTQGKSWVERWQEENAATCV